ncbi:FRIGIDA-like protein 4a [Wolffia australiana]
MINLIINVIVFIVGEFRFSGGVSSSAMAMELVERFQEAFEELEAQKSLIENCVRAWKSLTDHYSSWERDLEERSKSLESKLIDLESESAQSLEALSQRESAIPERESAETAVIERRRDAAISEMEGSPSESPDIPSALRGFCRRMDFVGLGKFMVSRRKDTSILRREISDSVAEAVDPARLIIDAVSDLVDRLEDGAGVSDRCWACSLLLRTLSDGEEMHDAKIPTSIKERAENLAKSWKKKVEERKEGLQMGAAEGQLFLELIEVFGLQIILEEDFVKKLIVDFAPRKDILKIAGRLGLGEKLRDIIDEMVKREKEIDAVFIAHEAGLTDDFSPISILMSYLETSRKSANTILKNGNHSLSATEESTNLELNALRSIIKCVELLNLEQDFTLESPRKRVQMLEKAKAERKRAATAAAAAAARAKRSRTGAPVLFRPGKASRGPSSPCSSSRRQQSSVEQYIPPPRHPFGSPGGGPGYDRSPPSSHYVPEDVPGPGGGVLYSAPPPAGYQFPGGYDDYSFSPHM